MQTLELQLTVGLWGSKHSQRVFNDWQHIAIPKAAKQCIPDWHKEQIALIDNVRTIKRCMPVTDIITAGYILPAPVDIKVYRNEQDDLKFDDTDAEFFVTRHAPMQYNNTPYKDDVVLKFDLPWAFRTPPGYSMMYLPAMHRDNSKLEALTAIVETDTYFNSTSCPVRIKDWKDGEILEIPKGYPLVQAIPVKRDDWKLSISQVKEDDLKTTASELASNPSAYRDEFRKKKKFT